MTSAMFETNKKRTVTMTTKKKRKKRTSQSMSQNHQAIFGRWESQKNGSLRTWQKAWRKLKKRKLLNPATLLKKIRMSFQTTSFSALVVHVRYHVDTSPEIAEE